MKWVFQVPVKFTSSYLIHRLFICTFYFIRAVNCCEGLLIMEYILSIISLDTCCMVCSPVLGLCSNITISETPVLTLWRRSSLPLSFLSSLITFLFLRNTFYQCTGNAIFFTYLFIVCVPIGRWRDFVFCPLTYPQSPDLCTHWLLFVRWLRGNIVWRLTQMACASPLVCAAGRTPIHHGVPRTLQTSACLLSFS